MQRLPQLLDLPAEEAVRLVALDLVAEAVRARARLDDASDTEALHDFRVALRRLRSWVRSYRPQLTRGVPKRLRRRFRRFAGAAGKSRDLEVQIQWLRPRVDENTSEADADGRAILERLEARKARADRKLQMLLQRDFAETTTAAKRRLGDYRAHLDPDRAHEDVAGAVMADRIRQLAADLERTLAAIGSVEEIEPAHGARIAAKHVRYALEPVASLVDVAAPVITRLKSLQDVLGTLHDRQVLQQRLGKKGDRSHPEPLWLNDLLRRQQLEAMEQLRREWLTPHPTDALSAEIRAVADCLEPSRIP